MDHPRHPALPGKGLEEVGLFLGGQPDAGVGNVKPKSQPGFVKADHRRTSPRSVN